MTKRITEKQAQANLRKWKVQKGKATLRERVQEAAVRYGRTVTIRGNSMIVR